MKLLAALALGLLLAGCNTAPKKDPTYIGVACVIDGRC